MNVPTSDRSSKRDITSHGVMLVCDGYGLFLQSNVSYEYMHVLYGTYNMTTLYKCLSIMSENERHILLNEEPLEQWKRVFPRKKMPRYSLRRLIYLKIYLPDLLNIIPSQHEHIVMHVPKGRLSRGETSKEAAVRELKEEAGITISISQLEDTIVDRYIGTDNNIYVTNIYVCNVAHRPNVTLGREFNDYAWLPI